MVSIVRRMVTFRRMLYKRSQGDVLELVMFYILDLCANTWSYKFMIYAFFCTIL